MKKGFWVYGVGLHADGDAVSAVPAGAQSVDDKIKALSRVRAVKSQQMELKKESTHRQPHCRASLSSGQRYEHRSGRQVMGNPLRMEAHIRTMFESGQDAIAGPTVSDAAPLASPDQLLHRQLSV